MTFTVLVRESGFVIQNPARTKDLSQRQGADPYDPATSAGFLWWHVTNGWHIRE
jgi:hypothetical protein